MISQAARTAMGGMLRQGVRASLLVSPEDSIEFVATLGVGHIQTTHIVMLSVSSYCFRLVLLIHFSPDEATRNHFSKLNKVVASDMNDQAFTDAISECGNICCGSINRGLAKIFPHVGMSTPNIIDRQCANSLALLGGTFEEHVDIILPGGPKLHASLCVSEFEDLDFDVAAGEEESSGELEMF
jgi:hypothetical protein